MASSPDHPLPKRRVPSRSRDALGIDLIDEAEATASLRYGLPKDLDAAIKRLDDQQLERLTSAVLEERTRRRKPPLPKERQRKRHSEAVAVSLPLGKLNAVRAAFQAGITPNRIAREFGLSRSDVQRALAGDTK
jgi:hypothetical protein